MEPGASRAAHSFCVFTALFLAGPAQAEDEPYNGQDPTRPVTRVDLRYQYQNAPPPTRDDVGIVTLRADKGFGLGKGWTLAMRVDAPFISNEFVTRDNLHGERHTGAGDLLVQGLLIKAESPSFAWAVGAQAIFPTASEDGLGNGKYRLVPTIGVGTRTPSLGESAWAAALLRYDFDVAGKDDRRHISELQFAPMVNIPLPRYWFVNLYPSTDIRYNFMAERPGDTGKWFVPFNFMVGRMLDRVTVASVEMGIPVVNDYKVYDFKLEARIGRFF